MNRLPQFYNIPKSELNVTAQVNRLKQKVRDLAQVWKDYYKKYYYIIRSLIEEKVIIFDTLLYECKDGINKYLDLQCTIFFQDILQRYIFIPLLIKIIPVEHAMERPPALIQVLVDDEYQECNSQNIINSSKVLQDWKKGDAKSNCGLKSLIVDLRKVFTHTYPLQKRESCVINPREIINIEQFNGDTHNSLYYGLYHKIPVFIKTISVINTEINAIKRECEIQSTLSNPYITQFIGYYIVDNSISFVTKRAECTLLEFLQNHPSLSILQKKYILYSIAYGLTYLKWKKVMHHDLKLTNILVDKNRIILCDFGSSCRFSDSYAVSTSIISRGNILHQSPALHYNLDDNERKIMLLQEDVYAFGVIIMEVLLGEDQFIQYAKETHIASCYPFKVHPSLKKDPVLYQIVADCMKEYKSRPSIFDIAKRIYDWQPDETVWE